MANVGLTVATTESALTAGGAADAKMFDANAGRLYLGVFNNHATQDLYVRFGGGAAAVGVGVKIPAGTGKEWPSSSTPVVPGDEVHVIGSGAGTTMYAIQALGKKVT